MNARVHRADVLNLRFVLVIEEVDKTLRNHHKHNAARNARFEPNEDAPDMVARVREVLLQQVNDEHIAALRATIDESGR